MARISVNMGPERELRVRAVTLATLTLLLDDDNGTNEVFECLLLNSRRPPRRTEVPRIWGYAETVVPLYSVSDFHQHFQMSRGTFERMLMQYPGIPQTSCNGGRPPVTVSKHLLITYVMAFNNTRINEICC